MRDTDPVFFLYPLLDIFARLIIQGCLYLNYTLAAPLLEMFHMYLAILGVIMSGQGGCLPRDGQTGWTDGMDKRLLESVLTAVIKSQMFLFIP